MSNSGEESRGPKLTLQTSLSSQSVGFLSQLPSSETVSSETSLTQANGGGVPGKYVCSVQRLCGEEGEPAAQPKPHLQAPGPALSQEHWTQQSGSENTGLEMLALIFDMKEGIGVWR